MAKIKQLNASDTHVVAVVDVNGTFVRVKLNNDFKSHLERNKAVIKKAEEQVNGD